MTNDRAILVRTTISYPLEIWVTRISDGKVISRHSYASNQVANVVASPDGAYVAENTLTTLTSANPNGSVSARIRRVSDWSVVVTLSASEGVLGFSADGSLVLVSMESSFSTQPNFFGIVDLKPVVVVWRNSGREVLGSFTFEPGSRSFALVLMKNPYPVAPGSTPDPIRDVLIVHGDGKTTQIAGRYATTW